MLATRKMLMVIWCLGCFISCSVKKDVRVIYQEAGYEFPYQLDSPDKSWKLPASLLEISGLSFTGEQRLACVQDEKGLIFLFNLVAGAVDTTIDFAGNGDYEGVEVIGRDAWVLESKGDIYKVSGYRDQNEIKTVRYKTALSGKNNAEGLGYDPVTGKLLIACKGFPFIEDKEGRHCKAVYRFDPADGRLDEDPFLLIHLDTIRAYKNENAMTRLGDDIMSWLEPSGGDQVFQPSGIAIHPKTGNIYVLGSVGKLLLVFSREGKMLAMVDIHLGHFRQPEGICFSPAGTLYISNEGHGQKGTLLKFEP